MSAERPRVAGPRPRALAELPVEALVVRAEELAKEWLIALISERPLEELGELPLELLARDAPILIAQTIKALGADRELDRLTAPAFSGARGELEAGRALVVLSAARDGAATVRAAEALRAVLWQGALLDRRWQSQGSAATRQLSDLAERVAYVCASILAAALEGSPAVAGTAAGGPAASAPAGRGSHAVGGITPGGAVLVDERAEAAVHPTSEEQSASREQQPERPQSWDASPPRPARTVAPMEPPSVWEQTRPDSSGEDEIAIRDARGEDGPAAWIGSIGRQLELAQESGRPFAVMLVEPREIEHLRASEPSSELMRLSQELEDALAIASGVPGRGEAAPSLGRVSLTRERPGRYWLLSAETDRSGAASLAERLRRALGTVVEHRGAPLDVVIGTAICPEDGRTPAALAAHADVSLYAARSAARASGAPRATTHDR